VQNKAVQAKSAEARGWFTARLHAR